LMEVFAALAVGAGAGGVAACEAGFGVGAMAGHVVHVPLRLRSRGWEWVVFRLGVVERG